MAPGTAAVTEMAAIYLARRGMKLAELADLRLDVEVAVTDLAAARIDDEGIAGLHEALAREGAADETGQGATVHDLHAAVAAAAHNRVLQLVALVLIRLSRLPPAGRPAPRARRQVSAEVHRTHQDIAACDRGRRPRAGSSSHAPAPRRAGRPHAVKAAAGAMRASPTHHLWTSRSAPVMERPAGARLGRSPELFCCS